MEKQAIIYSKIELKELIDESVVNALSTLKWDNRPIEPTYPRKITRKQLSERYHISYPTILKYEKEGIIHGDRIGRRVLFDVAQLEQCLTKRHFNHG
jgi:hypothetical protein